MGKNEFAEYTIKNIREKWLGYTSAEVRDIENIDIKDLRRLTTKFGYEGREEYKEWCKKERERTLGWRDRQKWDGTYGIPRDHGRAEIERNGNSVIVRSVGKYEGYKPDFCVKDMDYFDEVLQNYIDTIKQVKIEYTKMDACHQEKSFLSTLWKNATAEDFKNPEVFVNRYINFIKDTTFSDYDEKTEIGNLDGHKIFAQRCQAPDAFETPYEMQLTVEDNEEVYYFPTIRYGISKNRLDKKIAYIYALQGQKHIDLTDYQKDVEHMIRQVNKSVKKYRNVTPSAIATISIFMGMLEKEGIESIKVPDLLVNRYGTYSHLNDEYDIDDVQENLTNKHLRNFLRLDDQFENLDIKLYPQDGYNDDFKEKHKNKFMPSNMSSFLCMTLHKGVKSNSEFLKKLYEIGAKPLEKEIEEER